MENIITNLRLSLKIPIRDSSSSNNSKLQLPKAHDYTFYLLSTSNNLICSINGTFQYSFIKSLMDVLDVLNIQNIKATFETDFKKFVWIKFPNPVCAKGNKFILAFIKKLKEFKINEKHENEDSSWFYSNNGGNEILNAANYPLQLCQYLNDEKIAFKNILSSGNYTTLVEVGCGEMENLSLAKENKMKYLGLDFSPQRISQAKEKIKRNKLDSIQADCLNIINIEKDDIERLLLSDEKPLFIFPFNVFGNIAPISLLLSKFKLYNLNAAISIYKTDNITNKMREEYYSKCGYHHIEKHEDYCGTLFKSEEGLYTVAYTKDYLVNLMSAMGFEVSVLETGSFGYVLHIKNLC